MMTNKYLFKIFFILVMVLQLNCESKREALGADNEIRVICSDVDREIIESYLKNIFTDTIYTPEPEPYYYLKFSNPNTYNELKAQSKVVIAAVSRDNGNPGLQLVKKLLPEKQFETMINLDPVLISKNVFAKNQLFIVINALTKDQLFDTIKKKKNNYRKIFNDNFKSRQKKFIFGVDRNRGIEDSLINEYGWSMKIPWGWINIKNNKDSNFVWLGKEMPFQWIGISWYEGNHISEMNLIQSGEFLWEWPKKFYKNIQFNDHKFKLDETDFNGFKAWRLKGVWETIDMIEAKGGPFCSYFFYNKSINKTFHFNYLIHHPGKNKSINMRQMDLIIKSFIVE